jgi:hypothetical protein
MQQRRRRRRRPGADRAGIATSVPTYRRRAYEQRGISTALQLAARLFH